MLVRARPWVRSAVLLRGALVVSALLATGLAAACGDDEPTPSARTSKPRGFAPQAVETQPSKEPPAQPTFRRRPMLAEGQDEEAPVKATKEEEKPRDYSAELLAAARGAEACVQPRPASQVPPEISVSLEGLVLESGSVVTGSARAGSLTPEELECIKKRLEATRLAPGVKDAPRRVSATLRLLRPPAPAAAGPAPTGTAQTGAANAAAAAPTPSAPAPNPNEDPPEPVAPENQDLPEPVPTENQDLPEEVLPSQN